MPSVSDIHHRVPQSFCPLCGHKLDAASGMDTDDRPSPGDAGVCIQCATPLIYQDDLTMRAMTQAEINNLDPGCRRELEIAMLVVRSLDRRKKRKK